MSDRKIYQNSVLEADEPQTENPPAPVKPTIDAGKIALALFPLTPVPFSGPNMIYAIARIAGYSLLSYLTYNKMRPASYVFMGAAGVSLATSLTAGMWGKHEEKK
jgi:hypothetical protein